MNGEEIFKDIVSGNNDTILGDVARKGLGWLSKAYEKGVTAERAQEDVLSAVDTILSELMIRTRAGYSTPKGTLSELTDAKREADLALRISGIFQEQREVVAYSRLGIARLIYELPKALCELFLQEVFGEQLPDFRL